MTEAVYEAVHQVFWRLEQRWSDGIPDATVRHAYQALPPAMFLPPLLAAAELTGGGVFMDVGCGVGRNLALAHCLGWETIGVDIHQPYLAAAAELVPEASLIEADAFDLDRFDADVVYLYRPMVSADDEHDLETHVIERMTPGSILYLGTTEPLVPLERVAPCLWRVG